MSRPGDELLEVVSARKRLPWRAFRDAFDVLHLRALASQAGLDEPVGYLRQRSLRLLSDLGHAEIPPYGAPAAICAAPTVLARLPRSGLPVAILCGSRGAGAALALRDACSPFGHNASLIRRGQLYCGGYVPTTIVVEASDEEVLERVANRAGIQLATHPPAWRILRYNASIADFEAQLDWSSDPDPAWPRKDFSPASLIFSPGRVTETSRLSSFQDPVTRRQIHRIWQSGAAATVDRDWGRWLHLRDVGARVLFFDEHSQAVAVPATVPLPGLLGRALTLFSGFAPIRKAPPADAAPPTDLYTGVPFEAAELLGMKLGQQLTPHHLER